MAFRIYTKTGDQGETGLFGGKRLPKSHLRIEAYGTVDELNSFVGLVRDNLSDALLQAELKYIQDRLFTVGASLASDPAKQMTIPDLSNEDVSMLEQAIDRMSERLPELKHFILPGGHPTVSFCHVARCVCRRAERLTVALSFDEPVEPIVIQYLNRLSDYLFVLARQVSQLLGVEEIKWQPRNK